MTSRREPTEQATAELRPQVLAVLVAEATNLGLATMAHASGIPLHKLEQVYDWYFREETLRAAIDKIIGYHRSLPLTLKFGDGTTSSSDGIRFGMAASSLNARHLPRYFGVRRGVTLYNHTTNQGNQPWIDVVNCLVRESTYVLDGLLYQDAPAIKEHYTDTGGFTELMFGLFSVLGFRFAPRLRDLSDQTLYRARRGTDYGVLAPVLKKDVRDTLIVAHWDEPLSASSIAQRWPGSPIACGVETASHATAESLATGYSGERRVSPKHGIFSHMLMTRHFDGAY